jgi:acylphosphatase
VKRVRAVVRGRVQGVGFRAAAAAEARRRQIVGWAKNRLDGDLEVLAAGPAAAVDELCAWLRHGPRGARVTGLDVNDDVGASAFESLTDFDVH